MGCPLPDPYAFTESTPVMQGALKLNPNGSVAMQDDDSAVLLDTEDCPDCDCGEGCQVHYLYQCDPDHPEGPGTLTVFYVTDHAFKTKFAYGVYIISYVTHCYFAGPCVENTGGTDASDDGQPIVGAISCTYCVAPPPVFNCVPDLAEDYTDAEIEAMYPDIRVMFAGVQFCPCEITATGGGQYHDISFNLHPILLTPGPLSRDVDGHSRSYQWNSINDPNFGLTDIAPIHGCEDLGAGDCTHVCAPGDDSYNYNEFHITIGLYCHHTEDPIGSGIFVDQWGGGSQAQFDTIRATCFFNNVVQNFIWAFGITGLIDTVGNDVNFLGGCGTPPIPGDHPCGLGSMLSFAMPPGIP